MTRPSLRERIQAWLVKTSNRTLAAWFTTALWLVAVVWMLLPNWNAFVALPLNEKGDFIAGAAAPLAFLWLVIGYFQQGDELQQNTHAIRQQERALLLQLIELQLSVSAQSDLSRTNKEQLELQRSEVAEGARQRRHQAQPIARFVQGQLYWEAEGARRYVFTIVNMGAAAIEVVLRQIDQLGQLKFDLTKHDEWAESSEISWECMGPPERSGQATIELAYIDAVGLYATQVHALYVENDVLSAALQRRSIDPDPPADHDELS